MVRDGAQGPGAIEMVKRRVPTRMERQRTGPAAWLIVPRRPLADERTGEPRASRAVTEPEARYRYHDYCTPTQGATVPCPEPAVEALARGSNAGAGMESSFKRGKGAGGMDAYQGRTWHGWHPHMTLALLAVWFLPGATHRGQQVTPALPLPQGRYGLSLLLLEVYCTPGVDAICRRVQRQ